MTAMPGTHITFSDFIFPRIEDFTAYAAHCSTLPRLEQNKTMHPMANRFDDGTLRHKMW